MRRYGRVAIVAMWVVAGGGLLWAAFLRLDAERLSEHLAGASVWLLACSALVDLTAPLTRGIKWRTLLIPVGSASALRLTGAIYAGAAASTIMPFRLDEFVRAYAAYRFTGLPGLELLGSMALERLVDLLGLLLVLGLLAWFLPFPDWLSSAVRLVVVVVGLLAVVLAVLQATRGRRTGRIATAIYGFARGSRALRRPRLVFGALAILIVEWSVMFLAVTLAMAAVGVSLPWPGQVLAVALLMCSFGLPLAPAGIGVYEVAMRLALPPLFGISEESAVAAALAVHVVMLVPVTVIGVTVLASAGIRWTDVDRFRSQVRADGEDAP